MFCDILTAGKLHIVENNMTISELQILTIFGYMWVSIIANLSQPDNVEMHVHIVIDVLSSNADPVFH